MKTVNRVDVMALLASLYALSMKLLNPDRKPTSSSEYRTSGRPILIDYIVALAQARRLARICAGSERHRSLETIHGSSLLKKERSSSCYT